MIIVIRDSDLSRVLVHVNYLDAEVAHEFDEFRTPLTAQEIAHRKPSE